jgi:hypothetical protein
MFNSPKKPIVLGFNLELAPVLPKIPGTARLVIISRPP